MGPPTGTPATHAHLIVLTVAESRGHIGQRRTSDPTRNIYFSRDDQRGNEAQRTNRSVGKVLAFNSSHHRRELRMYFRLLMSVQMRPFCPNLMWILHVWIVCAKKTNAGKLGGFVIECTEPPTEKIVSEQEDGKEATTN